MRAPGDSGPAAIAHVRVSDADRDRVLAELRKGYAEGRLTHETFMYRVDDVLRARLSSDLVSAVADLPKPLRIGAVIQRVFRKGVQAVDHWLRGWPPVMQLPSGSQCRFTIGRELDCDMTLAHETVSRWHASLERSAGEWLLADLGSLNGTRLNGWRVTTPIPVRPGDMVSFGAMTFVLADRPAELSYR